MNGMCFGEILQFARRVQQKNISDVAHAAGLTSDELSSVESGMLPPPDDETIKRLAGALGISSLTLRDLAHHQVSKTLKLMRENPLVENLFNLLMANDLSDQDITILTDLTMQLALLQRISDGAR